tara:strand:+ start:221 stop:721 length:501 start_codon:yes stop_codon:yes gene_type:complete
MAGPNVMTNVIIENIVSDNFYMIFSFIHKNTNITIDIKERYDGGIVCLTQKQFDRLLVTDGDRNFIENWEKLQDLGKLISREFFGIDNLLKIPTFKNFLPLLDELENNDISNFELIDWFSEFGFKELGVYYEIVGGLKATPFYGNSSTIRLPRYHAPILKIVRNSS